VADDSSESVATPASESPAAETVDGEIVAIELQNINKALGHYTYNVELVVARGGDPDDRVRVRVDKVYWARMTEAEQSALAPEGPAERLTPSTWKTFSVGQTVSLAVDFTSPGLALLQASVKASPASR
jgi:hypothetical protein